MKFTTLITSFIFLCAGMCCPPEEDRNYENFEFDAPGLIEIQNERDIYSQNDTLWVKSIIPNTLLNETGEDININELSGNAGIAYCSFNLYLENNFNQPSPIVLSDGEIIPITGEAKYNYNITITALEINGQIESEFGIVLKEKGDYFLGSHYIPNPLSFYLESDNYNQILIETNFANHDSDQFRFSVE